jgi:hypothetical protein
LVVVDAGLERVALYTKSRLGGAVALELVDPDELVDAAILRNLAARDGGPRAVARVVAQLFRLGGHPDLAGFGGLAVI